MLGHTRWASVGIISQPNAHPLNAEELDRLDGPYVDRRAQRRRRQLRRPEGRARRCASPPRSPPTPRSSPRSCRRRLAAGADARRGLPPHGRRVRGLGRHRAPARPTRPADLLLALRGSGQALYVGLADDAYLVASEPYGLVEECDTLPPPGRRDAGRPSATRSAAAGQVVAPRRRRRPAPSRASPRWTYDGTRRCRSPPPSCSRAEITTRDIDRGDHPHFLLKEISEAPASFRKTLRGKLVEHDGRLVVSARPRHPAGRPARRAERRLHRPRARRSARAPPRSPAQALVAHARRGHRRHRPAGRGRARHRAVGLRAARPTCPTRSSSRSASRAPPPTPTAPSTSSGPAARAVVAIVNRRASDLTDKSDGVLYTSDGRDVEMSVASTKAFYAQVAAGFLLAYAIADLVAADPARGRRAQPHCSPALRDLPDAMEQTLDHAAGHRRGRAPARAAEALLGGRRHPAPTASRPRSCGSSSPSSATSRSPATPPRTRSTSTSRPSRSSSCAPTGLEGSNADDVAKEVAIYRAHKATPIVIATEGEPALRRGAAGAHRAGGPRRSSPSCSARWSATSSATRRRWPSTPRPCPLRAGPRRDRAAGRRRRSSRSTATACWPASRADFEPVATSFFDGLRSGAYNGNLEAVAPRSGSPRCCATASAWCRSTRTRSSTAGSARRASLIEDLTVALTGGHRGAHPARSTRSSTRPRRSPSASPGPTRALLQVGLVREALDAGAARDRLSYRSLRALAGLDPAVADVVGYTRYVVEGDVADPRGHDHRRSTGAASPATSRSRTERNPILRGTKHRVATEREVTAAVGRSDGRTLIIVPEIKGNQCTGLTLLHVRFHDRLPADHGPLGARAVPRPLRRPAGRGHRDRADLPRRPARRGPARRAAHRAGLRPRRTLALPTA